MNEATFWRNKVRPGLCNAAQALFPGAYDFERVENRVSVGTPDVDYCVASYTGKIELKYVPLPALKTTQVLGDKRGLSQQQRLWAQRRARAGGFIWLLIGAAHNIYLLDLRSRIIQDRVNGMTARELEAASVWCHVTQRRSLAVDWVGALRALLK